MSPKYESAVALIVEWAKMLGYEFLGAKRCPRSAYLTFRRVDGYAIWIRVSDHAPHSFYERRDNARRIRSYSVRCDRPGKMVRIFSVLMRHASGNRRCLPGIEALN